MSEALLKVSGLTMRFGGLLAVDSVAFEVKSDEVFAIIGPNGAGKTTCSTAWAVLRAHRGRDPDGRQGHHRPAHQVARHGLVRTFQNVRLFKQLTVLENLLVAQHAGRARLLPGLLSSSSLSPVGSRCAGARGAMAGLHGPARVRQPRGRQRRLRPPAPPGDRALHDPKPRLLAAGRAGRRPEPRKSAICNRSSTSCAASSAWRCCSSSTT